MRLLLFTTLLTTLMTFSVTEKNHAIAARQKICKSSDAEEGANYFVSGITTVTLNDEIVETKKDVCESDEMLIEYFCDSTNHTIMERRFPCRQGCSEAKCKTAAPVNDTPPSDPPPEDTPAEDTSVQQVALPKENIAIEKAGEESEKSDGEGVLGFLKNSWEKVRSTLERFFSWVVSLVERD